MKITSDSGTVRYSDICDVTEVYSASLKGDVNGNGEVNITDAVLLQGYLLDKKGISDIVWENSDINDDSDVDSFDMVLMRRILFQK